MKLVKLISPASLVTTAPGYEEVVKHEGRRVSNSGPDEDPTPLGFYRFIDASQRQNAKGEYKDHWEIWKEEKSKSEIVSEILGTNHKVHDKFNTSNSSDKDKDVSIDETDTEALNDDSDSDFIPSDIEYQSLPPPLILTQLKEFHKQFTNMSRTQNQEDALKIQFSNIARDCKMNRSCIHEELFTIEEWKEIQCASKKLPEVDETFVKSMMRFVDVKTTYELRQVLITTSFVNEDSYSREVHFNAEWAEIVIRKFLGMTSMYGHIVDHGLSDILGMEIESSSEAVSARKNRKRENYLYRKAQRKKMGYKMDGIFRTYLNKIEYGAIEVAKKYDQTKLLADGFKAMHDIFVCLCKQVDFEETKIRKLQIPGILHLGLKFQVLQMNSPKGYKMITDTMKIVLTPQEAYEFYRELVGQKPQTDELEVPWSLDSIR
ncbi:38226_t:CDS:10 [Gigaspora margarita]|uniref:38226_t:CDS:1 n=1 Tax=Gigaspora margarita TaxID=4874 RepID=A0ABN7UF83_GIGMA|nr:38226_t:CDS:10 [Gigaspora margarita]